MCALFFYALGFCVLVFLRKVPDPAKYVSCPQARRRRTHRAIHCHPASEPPMSVPVPVPCVNQFSLLSEESLYNFPLDLGLSVEALAAAPVLRARRHCISSAGIGAIRSGVDAQAKHAVEDSVNSIKPAEVTFPVLDVPELDTLVSRAPAHIGQTFVKQALSSKSTMPASDTPVSSTLNLGKEVADIVRGLGIPCKDTDFHCTVQNDCPSGTHTHDPDPDSDNESTIWNHKDKSNWEDEPDTMESTIPEPAKTVENAICQLLVKLHDSAAQLPARATSGSAGYELYSC